MNTFQCSVCKEHKQSLTGISVGYAVDKEDNKICYLCCAALDKQWMDEHTEIILYLTLDDDNPYRGRVTNWPGTLSYSAKVRKGRHNIARHQYHVTFTDYNNNLWWGRQTGDNTEVCYCKKYKVKDN